MHRKNALLNLKLEAYLDQALIKLPEAEKQDTTHCDILGDRDQEINSQEPIEDCDAFAILQLAIVAIRIVVAFIVNHKVTDTCRNQA